MLKDTSFEQILLILALIFLPINNMPVAIPLIGKVLSNLFLLTGLLCYIYKVGTRKDNVVKLEFFFANYFFSFTVPDCFI